MNGPVRSSFLYLMNLAYKSRLYVPFLLTACFLVLDIRLQLEVHINMTRHRARQRLGIEVDNIEMNDHVSEEEIEEDDERDDEEDDETIDSQNSNSF